MPQRECNLAARHEASFRASSNETSSQRQKNVSDFARVASSDRSAKAFFIALTTFL
jgi:hypothetical protein